MKLSKLPCWQCGKKLYISKDGDLIFEEVVMPLGTMSVKVHRTCKANALRNLSMQVEKNEENGVTQVKRMSDDRGTPRGDE